MAKHEVTTQKLTPDSLRHELKSISQAGYDELSDGEHLVVMLDEIPALSPFAISQGDIRAWQKLRAIITAPSADQQSFGLVEVWNGQGERRLMLSGLAPEGGQARVAAVLDPNDPAVAGHGTWRSTIQVSPDNTYVAISHEGAGVTEVIGALDGSFQTEEHYIPPEMWAPPFGQTLDQCFPADTASVGH